MLSLDLIASFSNFVLCDLFQIWVLGRVQTLPCGKSLFEGREPNVGSGSFFFMQNRKDSEPRVHHCKPEPDGSGSF